MNPLKFLALVTLFFLDVHVRAETLGAGGDKAVATRAHQTVISLAPGALVTFEDAPKPGVRAVRGTVYLRGPAVVVTPFGSFACDAADCQALISRRADGVDCDALSDGWRVEPRGFANAMAIPGATRLTVGEVQADGRAAVESPAALVAASLLKSWARAFDGTTDEFAARARELRPRWDRATEALANDQRGRALAMIDQQRVEADRRAAAARAASDEDKRLRKLFREKNYVVD